MEFSTKELSKKTWRDFEKLFKKPGEWQACWCLYYHNPKPWPKEEKRGLSMEQRIEKRRKEHKKLVENGNAHGILVFSNGDPVGWCQYGPKEELPRIDAGRKYRNLSLLSTGKRLWRITCFCVDRNYRKRGIASLGLNAALESIRKRGGGTVEAYPITRRGALASWFGTVSMFKEQGFRIAAPFGKSMVLMRKDCQR